MAVYVDNAGILWKGKKRYHLTADSIKEMHDFCKSNNINKCWFDNHPKHPHYDITFEQRERSIKNGAFLVTSKELLTKSKKLIGDNNNV